MAKKTRGKVVHGVLSSKFGTIGKFQISVMVLVLSIRTWSLGEKNLFSKVFFLNGKKVYSSASLLFERICLSLPFRDKFCLKRDWMVGKSQKNSQKWQKNDKNTRFCTQLWQRGLNWGKVVHGVLSNRLKVWRKVMLKIWYYQQISNFGDGISFGH